MISITRRYRFSASHRLHAMELSSAENAQLYGKCNNPFGHGHDYLLEVTATGPVNVASGLILPIAKLDKLVDEQVLRLFASRNINLDVPQFKAVVPTTENIAGVISRLIEAAWESYIGDPAVHFIRVHVQETDRNGFEILTAPNHFRSESTYVHA
jgi:6-pyruvoyltetrahydropterin/6-carboxytetrahydropterin synthase